jgi:hypothetical protein
MCLACGAAPERRGPGTQSANRTKSSKAVNTTAGREDLLYTKNVSVQESNYSVNWQAKPLGETLPEFALVFAASFLILFVGMSRLCNVYDEGLALTGAMRVAAGQIPHRDFYANYGPAQFYTLAGLFKIFGASLLVERLFDLLIKATLVTWVYALTFSYCRRTVAIVTSLVTVLWLFGLPNLSGTANVPSSLLNLVSSTLILPVFLSRVSPRRMFTAGIAVGTATLFRYDTGLALVGIHACIVIIAIYCEGNSSRVRSIASTLWPYLLGIALMVGLPALYYLSVAPFHDFAFDMFIYPARYYHGGRNLPFPGIDLKGLENLEVYLPVAAIVISFYVAFAGLFGRRGNDGASLRSNAEKTRWHGFLLLFALLALVMYLKAFVRMSVYQLNLCIIPSLLLIAVLFEHRFSFSRPLRVSVSGVAGLSMVAATWCALHQVRFLQLHHASVPESIYSSARGTVPETEATWCNLKNSLTKGFCFFPEIDRVRTIEFIDSHTVPGQKLYVGATKHDRIYANDNLMYFGSQRLPATKWSHFDPGLQNTSEIQTEMMRELAASAPPYIVLNSEFDLVREANDSSISTGVTLLDEYIRSKYRKVQTFGMMSVWERVS